MLYKAGTILPDRSVVDGDGGIAVVVLFFTTETEQTGTSDVINRNIAVNDIVPEMLMINFSGWLV